MMNYAAKHDHDIAAAPAILDAIQRDTAAIEFGMASEPKTGALLRALAASKPGGRLLELGTGTGVGTAWILAGMDPTSHLVTVDHDSRAQAVARRHLGDDRRVTFDLSDAGEFLARATPHSFDLVYADAWAGKYSHRDEALQAVRLGGIYFVDDLLPQPNWPEGHHTNIPPLLADLQSRPDFVAVHLKWASGLMMLVRTCAR